jgi:hypothetical protein
MLDPFGLSFIERHRGPLIPIIHRRSENVTKRERVLFNVYRPNDDAIERYEF